MKWNNLKNCKIEFIEFPFDLFQKNIESCRKYHELNNGVEVLDDRNFAKNM